LGWAKLEMVSMVIMMDLQKLGVEKKWLSVWVI